VIVEPSRIGCRCAALLAVCTLLPGLLAAQELTSGHAVVKVLGSQGRRALELARLRSRDPRLQDAPVHQSIWLRESGASDSMVFDLLPFASAPRKRDGIAIAYDEGTGSRMWSGFTNPNPARSALLGSASQAILSLWRVVSPVRGGPRDLLDRRRCPGMRLRVGGEALDGFGTDGRDTPVGTRAVILYADCHRDLGKTWRLTAGLRGYSWRTPGVRDRQEIESSVRLARIPPGDALRLFADASWTPHYERALLHVERPASVQGIRLRPFVRLAWGEGLPFGLGFWPGGYDGFPGMRDGEGRGNREAMAALDVSRPIAGRLSIRAMFAVAHCQWGAPAAERSLAARYTGRTEPGHPLRACAPRIRPSYRTPSGTLRSPRANSLADV
jgi:hypothetical protein